jgi:hypothetical protein
MMHLQENKTIYPSLNQCLQKVIYFERDHTGTTPVLLHPPNWSHGVIADIRKAHFACRQFQDGGG